MKKISVVLVDDHTVVREGIRSLLAIAGGTEVVGEASDGRQAVEMAHQLHPAVVVMDIGMPELNGFEAVRRILQEVPGTRVLILSAHADDAYVDHLLALGVSGYVIKQSSAGLLLTAIRKVAEGGTFFSPEVARRLRDRTKMLPSHAGVLKQKRTQLSPRETETLQLIAEGKANKQIAAVLGIGIKTVEKHRHNLMDKLGIHDTAGLTRHAIAAGMIEGGPRITPV